MKFCSLSLLLLQVLVLAASVRFDWNGVRDATHPLLYFRPTAPLSVFSQLFLILFLLNLRGQLCGSNFIDP